MMALLTLLVLAATPSPLEGAVRHEVRAALGDADADVVVHDVRVGDRTLATADVVVALTKTPTRAGRAVRVRGTARVGARSTWLSATVEVRQTTAALARDPSGPLVVTRGDRVTARVSERHFRVSAEAEALASGRVGDRVVVRVVSSDKTLDGKVVAPGIVEIGTEGGR